MVNIPSLNRSKNYGQIIQQPKSLYVTPKHDDNLSTHTVFTQKFAIAVTNMLFSR